MSINKRLFLLIYLIAICASCTKEDVTRRAEGDITIKPLWKEYIVGKAFPPEIEYYLYNLDNISISPIIISDPKGEGFTKRLPVGTYRLIGYNKADASKNITFKDSKPSTVVAKISQDDFIPLNLYIVSCDNILIKDNSAITKEIVPIEVKAKTLSLNFSYRDELNPLSLKGKIEGISTSINLLNGEAFEDENFISFETKGNNSINLRTSGLLYTSSLSADSRNYELIPPVLSLTFEDGSYTGDVSLENIIKELDSSPQKPNDITLDVIVKKYTPQYEKYKNRILIETYLNKDK